MLKSWGDKGGRKKSSSGRRSCRALSAKLAGAGHGALKLFKPSCCSLNEVPDISKVGRQGEAARCSANAIGLCSLPRRVLPIGAGAAGPPAKTIPGKVS